MKCFIIFIFYYTYYYKCYYIIIILLFLVQKLGLGEMFSSWKVSEIEMFYLH